MNWIFYGQHPAGRHPDNAPANATGWMWETRYVLETTTEDSPDTAIIFEDGRTDHPCSDIRRGH
jgi:hypothetical protein